MMKNNLRSLMLPASSSLFSSITAHCIAEAVASQLATARQNCETGSHQQTALALHRMEIPIELRRPNVGRPALGQEIQPRPKKRYRLTDSTGPSVSNVRIELQLKGDHFDFSHGIK